MNAFNLQRQLDDLQNRWSALDQFLDFWTILVALGVVVELLVLIAEYFHVRRDFKRGEIHPPEKPSLMLFGSGFLGAALVAAGVSGEVAVHFKAVKVESDIRNTTLKLVALVNAEAQAASERAAKADLARFQLEKSMMWRHLTKRQADSLCSLMPKAPPGANDEVAAPYRILVTSSPVDSESWTFASEIRQALAPCNNQGLPYVGEDTEKFPHPILFGLWVRTRKSDRENPKSPILRYNPIKRRILRRSIRKRLEGLGITVDGDSDEAGAVVIELYVGPRPPPR